MDALDRQIRQKMAQARADLLKELEHPTCRCCKRPLDSADEWITTRDLILRVYADPKWKHGDSSTIHCVVFDLIDEGIIETNDRLQLRLKR